MPSKKDLLDLQFVDARHKLIDVAAFLDRIQRHPGESDYRFDAFKSALSVLLSDRSDRARAVLESFSDDTAEVPLSAPFQGAHGAAHPRI